MNINHFDTGQTIVCRDYWQDKVWSERPEIVVQDNPDMLALYLPPKTVINQPVSPAGAKATYKDRLNLTWSLSRASWIGLRRLRLSIPGAFYSVLLFWNEDSSLRAWYINLEEPITRSPDGFDYTDLFLDILAEPDLSSWRWLDEDELQEAVSHGYISEKTSEMFYAEGKKVIESLQSGNSPFNGWETWKPDPAWQMPVLPEM